MSTPHADRHRRRFIRFALAGALAAPFAALPGTRNANAADKPKLDPASDMARRLSYTHDAESTDNSARKADARCANCTHFRGDTDTRWASCNIFPEHLVNADGWCTSWFSAG